MRGCELSTHNLYDPVKLGSERTSKDGCMGIRYVRPVRSNKICDERVSKEE